MALSTSVAENRPSTARRTNRVRKKKFLGLRLAIPPAYVEVIPNSLYLGRRTAAYEKDHLQKDGITHIVNCTTTVDNVFEDTDGFKYYRVDVLDSAESGLALYEHFRAAADFIHQAMNTNKKVLVHCSAGISRSPSVIIAYMMIHQKYNLVNALHVLGEKAFVQPRQEFLFQLTRLEIDLFARKTLLVQSEFKSLSIVNGYWGEEEEEQVEEKKSSEYH